MTRISSLNSTAAKKKKMRTAAISGLMIAVVVIICFALLNESGDGVSVTTGGDVAAGQPAIVDTSMGGGEALSQQADAKSPPGDLRMRGAILTGKAEDFDPDASGGGNHEGEYPDGVVVAEDDHDDDYTDDVVGGLMEGGADDDEFLLNSPDGSDEPPTDDMMDDGIAEEV